MTAPAERLILAGLRAWALARLNEEPPETRVRAAISAVASDMAGVLFVGWMQAVERHASRAFAIGCLGCGHVSPDEQRLIHACGLAPVAFDLGEELLAPLQTNPLPAMTMARALNAALGDVGLVLPARLQGQGRPSATLH